MTKLSIDQTYLHYRNRVILALILTVLATILSSQLGVYILFPGVTPSAAGFAWFVPWLIALVLSIMNIISAGRSLHTVNLKLSRYKKADWLVATCVTIIICSLINRVPLYSQFISPVIYAIGIILILFVRFLKFHNSYPE